MLMSSTIRHDACTFTQIGFPQPPRPAAPQCNTVLLNTHSSQRGLKTGLGLLFLIYNSAHVYFLKQLLTGALEKHQLWFYSVQMYDMNVWFNSIYWYLPI